jgi:hypothetical protein
LGYLGLFYNFIPVHGNLIQNLVIIAERIQQITDPAWVDIFSDFQIQGIKIIIIQFQNVIRRIQRIKTGKIKNDDSVIEMQRDLLVANLHPDRILIVNSTN